jgi:hypothetical protein
MRRIRLSKVRITPPPGAGAKSSVERATATTGGSVVTMTGLDRLTESQKREAAEHDLNVRDYSPALLSAAYDGLKKLSTYVPEGAPLDEVMEAKWVRARRAALLRRGSFLRERGLV